MSIELCGITALGSNKYRLDFQDGVASVSFILEDVPRKGVRISREFGHHFHGRSSARDAFDALDAFIRGEAVAFPVKVREDGFTGRGR